MRVFVPLAFLLVAILFLAAPRAAEAAQMLPNLVLKLARGHDPAEGPYRFRCPVFGKCNHRIVGMFMTRRRGVPEAWVVAAIPNESDCHGCSSRMTLEVYRKRGGRWEKYRVWRNFADWGSWGVVRPQEVRMARIDNRRMVLFLLGGFAQMGEVTESMRVFVIDDEDITPARDFCLAYDNEAAITPESDIKLRKWSTRFRLRTVKGRPVLIFHIRDGTGNSHNTVVYEFMGKGLRLHPDSYPDPRLRFPCGE